MPAPQERERRNFFVRPALYDALSGEFNPNCDPDSRAHNLGRLVLATVQKGKSNVYEAEVRRGIEYRYSPSWAKSVSAETIVDTYEYAPNIFIPASFSLSVMGTQKTYNRSLSIVFQDGNTYQPFIHVSTGSGPQAINKAIELGNEMDVTRGLLASLAQQVLSRV